MSETSTPASPQANSLSPLASAVWQRRRVVLLITLGAVALGLLAWALRPAEYKAKVEFFLKNPMYADRSYLYSSDARMIDYFAGDEDIDRMKSLVWADTIQDALTGAMGLDTAYGLDRSSPAEAKALKKAFSERVGIYRTESKVVVLSYTDKDQVRAAAIATRCVTLLERQLRGFYNEMRGSIYTTLTGRIGQEDSAIAALTDTLTTLRERYGIYDIISPARYNIMLSAQHDNGRPGFARGVEEVQNIEAIKDQLVSDRAKHITLAGQYATGTRMDELPLTRILKREQPPFKREGPGLAAALLGCALIGLLAGLLWAATGIGLRGGQYQTSLRNGGS